MFQFKKKIKIETGKNDTTVVKWHNKLSDKLEYIGCTKFYFG